MMSLCKAPLLRTSVGSRTVLGWHAQLAHLECLTSVATGMLYLFGLAHTVCSVYCSLRRPLFSAAGRCTILTSATCMCRCCQRLSYLWCRGCRDLDKQEQQKREKEKEERRRKERKHRDAFKALLDRHRQEGLLHAKLRWKVCTHVECGA